MRTRIYGKLTGTEIKEYLSRGDIIFVPFGTVERHGNFPLDSGETKHLAFAVKMAEKVDGLVFGGLPYFFCGAASGRGNVQMSIRDGVNYLYRIAASLYAQGFRRQIYISSHSPAYIIGSTIAIDFFDEFKVPILYIDCCEKAAVDNGFVPTDSDSLIYGAYKVLDHTDEIPEGNSSVSDKMPLKAWNGNPEFMIPLLKMVHRCAASGFYLSGMPDQDSENLDRSEINALCMQGEKDIERLLESLDIESIVEVMRRLDVWTYEHILPNCGEHLPPNKYADVDR